MENTDFNWEINDAETWPPRGKIKFPIGVTTIEVLRSCPLRICFAMSRGQGYEPSMGYAARIGTAFHRTLEYLLEGSFPDNITPAGAAAQARIFFEHELLVQESERNQHAREKVKPRDQTRIARAQEAVIREARRMAEEGVLGLAHHTEHSSRVDSTEELTFSSATGNFAVEVEVKSQDGSIVGRIDRVEWYQGKLRIFDYKSALQHELPDRYRRQVQLYAWMWHQMNDEWPSEAFIIFPFTQDRYEVNIEPNVCKEVADETKEIIGQISLAKSPSELASPGAVCQVCEFRPWCLPFWRHQAAEINHRQALEAARYGTAGRVVQIDLHDHHWIVDIKWRSGVIHLIAPEERFPQLKKINIGSVVRLLDAQLSGQMYRPTAHVTEYTELYIVNSDSEIT